MSANSKFKLYTDPSQWVNWTWWYWKPKGAPDAEGHGPFPSKFLARVAGWLGTL